VTIQSLPSLPSPTISQKIFNFRFYLHLIISICVGISIYANALSVLSTHGYEAICYRHKIDLKDKYRSRVTARQGSKKVPDRSFHEAKHK